MRTRKTKRTTRTIFNKMKEHNEQSTNIEQVQDTHTTQRKTNGTSLQQIQEHHQQSKSMKEHTHE